MREIKFRMWDAYNETMRGWDEIKESAMQVLEYAAAPKMQFTGLHDRNGVEIYEGDIVKAASQGQHAICEIKWGQGRSGFFLHSKRGGIVWNLSGGGKDYREESVDIIGNIYENPELLEVQQ